MDFRNAGAAARRRIEELEAFAAGRLKEVCGLNAKIAELESDARCDSRIVANQSGRAEFQVKPSTGEGSGSRSTPAEHRKPENYAKCRASESGWQSWNEALVFCFLY